MGSRSRDCYMHYGAPARLPEHEHADHLIAAADRIMLAGNITRSRAIPRQRPLAKRQ